MMKFTFRYPLVALLATVLITACATPYNPLPNFNAHQIDPGRYDRKVDQLVFVLDASSSMAEVYQGYQKLDIARGVINHFNDTMPDLDVAVTLHSFGHADSVSSESSATLLPTQAYSREALATAVGKFQEAGGHSPLSSSLEDAAMNLKAVDAPIAMVIISDGEDMEPGTLAAAESLKAEHGDRLCIHTVHVGDSTDGAMLLSQIAAMSGCGEAETAGELGSGDATNAFVRTVLLTAKNDSDGDGVVDDKDRCPDTPAGVKVDMHGCPLDSDNDGVADYKDNCPNTPAGTHVDDKGCPVPVATKSAEVTTAGTWIYKGIQFENNKSDLRQSSFGTLNEIVAGLKAQPGLNIEIQGHTDINGTHAYNMDLSRRRAQSVKTYLESKGIDSSRLTIRGYGPDQPIATNATKEGRAKNRRVEIKPIR